jgi:hypothetical protein
MTTPEPRPKIKAKELLADIRSGMDDSALRQKYRLSAEGLQSVYNKLLQAGLITKDELDSVNQPFSNKTPCPACKTALPSDSKVCPHCGIVIAKYRAWQERVRLDGTASTEKQPSEVSHRAGANKGFVDARRDSARKERWYHRMAETVLPSEPPTKANRNPHRIPERIGLAVAVLLVVLVFISFLVPSGQHSGRTRTERDSSHSSDGMSHIKASCLATRNEKEWTMVMEMVRRGEREDVERMANLGLVAALRAGSEGEMIEYSFSRHVCKIRIPGYLGYWYVPSEFVD